MRTLVACADRMVFPVDPTDLRPLATAHYDPWIFCDPPHDAIVVSYTDWLNRTSSRTQGHR